MPKLQAASCPVARNNGLRLSWHEFFTDPSKWWHNVSAVCKPNPRYPDFKHKVTGDALWINSKTPSWVLAELRRGGFVEEPCHGTPAHIDSICCALRSCAWTKDLVRGTKIHHYLVQSKLFETCSDAVAVMYAKCGDLGKAKVLLDMQLSKDVHAWTSLIGGYLRKGQGQNALDCFEDMQRKGILPDAVTYTCALRACASIRDADKGKKIHDEIARQGLLQDNLQMGTELVNMYAQCGAISQALWAFNELPCRAAIFWTELIAVYAQQGEAEQALYCLEQMQHEGILPNIKTYGFTLQACTASNRVKQLFKEIAKCRLMGRIA